MDIWVVFTFFWLFYGQYYYENSWTGFFVWTYVFNSLARIPRNGIAESCGNSMFKLLTNCQTIFQKHLHHFALLSAVRGGSSFSISSPKSISSPFFFFYYNQPSRHKVVSHHGFNLRFSDGYWGWVFFHVLIGHVHIFFGEMSDWILCTLFTAIFVFLLLISVLCLTIVDDSIIISKWISFF